MNVRTQAQNRCPSGPRGRRRKRGSFSKKKSMRIIVPRRTERKTPVMASHGTSSSTISSAQMMLELNA